MDTENYYQKTVDLCREKGWWATYNAIVEEGHRNDGTNWKQLFEDFSNEKV